MKIGFRTPCIAVGTKRHLTPSSTMKTDSPSVTNPTVSPPTSRASLKVLKILQCTNFGGMEQVAYRLLEGLSTNKKCDFRIATPRPFGPGKKSVTAIDPEAWDFVYRGRFGWRSFPTFKKHVAKLAEEADSAWVTGTCVSSLAAIRKLQGRKVLSHHFHHFEKRLSRAEWYGFYNLLCRNLDTITYPTDFTRNEAISIAPWIREKSHVVRYGYTPRYANEEERLRLQRLAREELNLPREAFIVGNAGWLIQRKRFDVFLHTAQRIAESNPAAYFVICGGGPMEAQLKTLAASLGLTDRVHFTGWISDLTPYYQAWDVCLFNSDFDTLPCASMEPATHGCLVVGSLLYGGLSEFYRTGENGVLLNEHDPQRLASHIEALIKSPSMSLEFRQAAIEKLKSEYSMEKSLEFYRHALEGSLSIGGAGDERTKAETERNTNYPVPHSYSPRKERARVPPPGGKKVLVIWGNWGPYHYARFRAFREAGEHAGYEVEGLELFPSSGHYAWEVSEKEEGVHHLDIGPMESNFYPWRMTRLAVPKIFSLRPTVVFVPSYWHWSLYLNLASRLRGSRIVMMNESHGGTEKAAGWRRIVKKKIVRSFHAGLVGGTPHKRHYSALGLDSSRIFTGYDAIDNEYFAGTSKKARARAEQHRHELDLPPRYFLSLGRMVEKKNLSCLIEGYARFRASNPGATQQLVFVGSGEEETRLRELCQTLGLDIKEPRQTQKRFRPASSENFQRSPQTASLATSPLSEAVVETKPVVHFHGFRQIQENPAFYALADAFILPSRMEEWGLVVNEAMACGLPVIVSRNAGCAEDLVAHQRNGFLFDPDSSSELALHLEYLTRNPKQAEAMGRNSVERIRKWGCHTFAKNAILAAKAAEWIRSLNENDQVRKADAL